VIDVALVDCRDLPVDDGDRPLLDDALARVGLEAAWWSWDDPGVDWSATRLAVLRMTWDYPGRLREFLDWLDRASAATEVCNPPSVVVPNADKRYLLDLTARGLPVVPSLVTPGGRSGWGDVPEAALAAGWDQVVVKPVVGSGARGSYRAPAATLVATSPEPTGPVLVQPFVAEVATRGETSLIFVDGSLSHAVRKVPASGDYRVQEHLGGRTAAVDADPDEVAVAMACLATLAEPLLYARVDLVRWQGDPHLMELELIEPSLYLRADPSAADRFARAIARRLAAPEAGDATTVG
jgi:glutathione synthase/RimK-type ligase-like ATP-grasp enzyme